ncbi:MAG: FxsA family protein [Planctomycetota bacterium]|nr:FxsA family protein [Planctomycetota bacterium]
MQYPQTPATESRPLGRTPRCDKLKLPYRIGRRLMFFYLFLLFTLLPLAELALLIFVGSKTSIFFTISVVVATGLLGTLLARWQGWRAVERIRGELQAGRPPSDSLVDGLLILIAGVLLVSPGFLTDVMGIFLLIPTMRNLVKKGVTAWLRRNVQVHSMNIRVATGRIDPDDDIDFDSQISSDQVIESHVIPPTKDKLP